MPARETCARCGRTLQPYETITVTGVGVRCYLCFNEEASAKMGVDFDNPPLQPVTVTDAGGVEHTFEFRSMLVATGHALHAREALPAGREGCAMTSEVIAAMTARRDTDQDRPESEVQPCHES